jgi:uncharacterized Zn finger protein
MSTQTGTRTWWGERFIQTIENFTEHNRLARGRAYAHNGKIVTHTIEPGRIIGSVRGSVNPYFGVYREPAYTTQITVNTVPVVQWLPIIRELAQQASFVTQLLLGEMPYSIDDAMNAHGLPFLPTDWEDLKTSCTCPDFEQPCKHAAGLCYLFAGELDRDPFLLFELRGLEREQLRQLLTESPLGQLVATTMDATAPAIEPDASYYARPEREEPPAVTYRTFWEGAHRLPELEPAPHGGVPALTVRKQGDYPPFWHRDASFLHTIEGLYERVRARSPELR